LRIHYICYANVCRSPIAEALTRAQAKARQLDLETSSSGLADPDLLSYTGIHPSGLRVLSSLGIDASSHQPKRTTKEMIDKADLVLMMDYSILNSLHKAELFDPLKLDLL